MFIKMFVALFVLFLAGFTAVVVNTARDAYQDRIEELCEVTKNEWGFLAPPMEKNYVWHDRKASEEKMCASRRKSQHPNDREGRA